MDGDPTPALTGRRRIRPTSIGCRNPWQPKPGRAPLIAAHAAVQTNRATSLTTMGTGFLGSRTRHLSTSLSPTMPGSIGLRLGRVLYESWDGSDGSDTAAGFASGAQPDREFPRPSWLGGVRIL